LECVICHLLLLPSDLCPLVSGPLPYLLLLLFPYTTLFRSSAWVSRIASVFSWFSAPPTPARRTSSPSPTASARASRAGRSCCWTDRKSTRLNSSHVKISYAVLCLKQKILLVVNCVGISPSL